MTPESVEQLARNARTFFGEQGYAFIWTMAMTGMRPSGVVRAHSRVLLPELARRRPEAGPG